MLNIRNLKVDLFEKEIIRGISLKIKLGEVHAIMGPNGAGKTTLAMTLMSLRDIKPACRQGRYQINGRNMNRLKTEEIARAGLFVSFQQPVKIEGLTVFSFLRNAYKNLYPKEEKSILEFKHNILNVFKQVGLDDDFIQKYVNEGVSGGEKKRFEAAQFLIFKPKFAIFDEIDAGLDMDSLKKIVRLIDRLRKENNIGIIFITHNPRVFNFIKPDFVHLFKNGKIIRSDSSKLIKEIEKKGYDAI